MSIETQDTTSVEIMGRIYQIKCPEEDVSSLRRAAEYLHEKMRHMRETGVLSVDRVAVITALNIVHQLLTLEQHKNQDLQLINQRLSALQDKVEEALLKPAEVEFQSAE
jgi:cell division protein ZapA